MANEFAFLESPSSEVAPQLLGCMLEFGEGDNRHRVRIVEVEAYDQTDVASHSYRGETERTRVMFGPAGYLYVYFTYGMHYCMNVVVGQKGEGAAVLIRAVEPVNEDAQAALRMRRNKSGIELTNGPAKLCQALGVTKAMNGHDLSMPPLRLIKGGLNKKDAVVVTTRIGIREGKDVPWRFYIKGNPYVSVAEAK
ncbi:MAG TPA: DNA-3-methyladenine glycosylase [Candidatus Saccharimonadales bacterium]